jgi:hypothetical protein
VLSSRDPTETDRPQEHAFDKIEEECDRFTMEAALKQVKDEDEEDEGEEADAGCKDM